ncbi:MAG: hypothetical protein EHM70_06830 [Chloroflexota bacterium]|nr:MAG: hypothetical protein EHM70_06830 [Chloroflexota bacterium]
MNYDLIATLGPSSSEAHLWAEMLSNGVTAFRLNTSHLTPGQLQGWLDRLELFLASNDPRPALVLDLQGSKWRLGQFTSFELAAGQSVELVCTLSTRAANVLPVPHPDFFTAAPLSSDEIVLDDARVRLRVQSYHGEALTAHVVQGGVISPNKGITFTASEYRTESLSEKDRAIFEQTAGFASVRYAISYVKDAAEMKRYRELFGPEAHLVAKLERGPAVDQAGEIARFAGEVWLCRGDLGAELGMPGMARKTAEFSARIAGLPALAILAGQVLEHMSAHPHPTRSEVCYMYDALLRGYRGFVLSDETAIGRHPVEACRIAAMFK